MGIATIWVRATPSEKMHTGRGSVGRWFMGKITTRTSAAFTSLEELLADGDLVWIVDVET